MSYYIRKISRAKWPEDVSEAEVKDVRADAITGCLRTTSDELSLWKVEKIGNPEEDALFLTSLKSDGNFAKISDRKVKSIIKQLIESGRISAEQLNDTMQEKLGYVKVGDS